MPNILKMRPERMSSAAAASNRTGAGPVIAGLEVAVPHPLEINTSLPDNHPGDVSFAVVSGCIGPSHRVS